MARTLYRLGLKYNWDISVYAANDSPAELMERYLPARLFFAFSKNKMKYTLAALRTGLTADVVILSHINLSLVGCLLHLLNPKCRIFLIAHGIEVWRPLRFWKKAIWHVASRIVCVSSFTRTQVMDRHGASASRCMIINNALDPFLTLPQEFEKPVTLLERYRINPVAKVILTLTRISATEHFKGYDLIIQAVHALKKSMPDVIYLLAGPYDEMEKLRLDKLIAGYRLQPNVILTGFIAEDELSAHFLLADLFVLPSKKEGFGLVFMEAMAFGLPVICGNADGSTDAVRNEKMGTAIDPDDLKELVVVMMAKLNRTMSKEERLQIQQECLKFFNEDRYMNAIANLICDETAV